MGLLNVDSLINDSTFLSSTQKFVSSLNSAVGSGDEIKPKYVYPNDIDRQAAGNYMIIYIYDNKNNSTQFQPISTQIAKSKIQNDLVRKLTDCISIDLTDSTKLTLKNYKNAILDKLKAKLSGLFKDLDFSGIDLGIETPEWIKQVGDFWKDWDLSKGVKNLIDAIDLPNFPSLNAFDISQYIDIKLDKDKLNSIIKEVQNSVTANESEKVQGEAGEAFELVSSIVLPLPTNGISYNSKIGIEAASTKTAQAIKNVVDSFIGDGFKAGIDEVTNTFKAQGMELLYSTLGAGGSAIYQNTYGKIRDPLIAFTYSIPDPRTFEYDFLMAPRSKQELYDIWNIIKTLKFYSHMSIETDASAVRYYNFPGRFKIKYYTEGNENIWLGKTKILGLTGIQSNIDTSNIGFILNDFDNVSGNPPRVIALSLTFSELSILNRDDINGGY